MYSTTEDHLARRPSFAALEPSRASIAPSFSSSSSSSAYPLRRCHKVSRENQASSSSISTFAAPTPASEELPRSASRAGSISTLWSSADVPFCLDPRVVRMEPYSSSSGSFATSSRQGWRGPSEVSISSSSRSGSESSIAIVEEIRDEGRGAGFKYEVEYFPPSPPRRRSSSLSFTCASSGEPSHQPPRQSQNPGLYPGPVRRDESVCSMPVTVSYGSGLTHGLASPLPSPTASTRDTERSKPVGSPMLNSNVSMRQGTPRGELYAKADEIFRRDYSIASPPALPDGKNGYVSQHQAQRDSFTTSISGTEPDLSECSLGGSSHSYSQSNSSSNASSADSSYFPEPEEASGSWCSGGAPNRGSLQSSETSSSFQRDQTPTQEQPKNFGIGASGKDSAGRAGLPLSNSGSPRGFASRHSARPRTAETESPQGSPNRKAVKGPPHPIKVGRPMTTQAVFATESPILLQPQVSPRALSPPVQTSSKQPPTVGSKLRARALSTSKLRPSSPWKAFGADVPALPKRPSNAEMRPATAQVDGEEARRGSRFRSRTVGEADRAVSLQAPPRNIVDEPSAVPSAPLLLHQRMRRPSKAGTTSSSINSAKSFLQTPTPKSSNFSLASSNITSAPTTPKSPARLNTATKNKPTAGSGWASYLGSGLTLHIDQDGHRQAQMSMIYLSYDPFGSPETLVEGLEVRKSTPKRPKSRSDKDNESEQVGVLEFGQGAEQKRGWVFSSAHGEASPILRHLSIGDDTKADLLTRQAALSLGENGIFEVSGHERKGQVAWKFVYRVEDCFSGDGTAIIGEKQLFPVTFSCSATLLDPKRARKSRILNMVRKQVVSNLVSTPVQGSPASAKTELSDSVIPSPASGRMLPRKPSHAHSLAQSRRTSSRQTSYNDSWSPASAPQRLDQSAVQVPPNLPPGVVPFRLPRSAHSISSTNSSSMSHSQPSTPATPETIPDALPPRSKMQASPMDSKYGQHLERPDNCVIVRRSRGHSLGEASRAFPLGQASEETATKTLRVQQSSMTLQERSGMDMVGARSPAKSLVGKKLVPITLPPEFRQRPRIDPAQLEAHRKYSSQNLHSEAQAALSSMQVPPVPVAIPEVHAQAKAGSGRKRSNTTSAPRPPTASEAIKLEYLAREAAISSTKVENIQLSPEPGYRRTRCTATLAPSAFADEGRSRRQRSRTSGNGDELKDNRPFTADAWSCYPPMRDISVPSGGSLGLELSHDHPIFSKRFAQPLADRMEVRPTTASSKRDCIILDGAPAEGVLTLQDAFQPSPLPLPPRKMNRPRTAQNICPTNDADTGRPIRAAALVNFSPPMLHD
ncbi:hypothetical protein IE53DRAFT_369356 [Violaceomyces palustris]|uniref:Uncharacterized protein n=1 Tax=Violaceomyces palustris TaxID=1673888 RepID=A0ACD0NVW4_9BASI|nr:hypothetical protein IE53DRAFT_369356 [Violaceomyces palustris]